MMMMMDPALHFLWLLIGRAPLSRPQPQTPIAKLQTQVRDICQLDPSICTHHSSKHSKRREQKAREHRQLAAKGKFQIYLNLYPFCIE
jgi:hypothetical protein